VSTRLFSVVVVSTTISVVDASEDISLSVVVVSVDGTVAFVVVPAISVVSKAVCVVDNSPVVVTFPITNPVVVDSSSTRLFFVVVPTISDTSTTSENGLQCILWTRRQLNSNEIFIILQF